MNVLTKFRYLSLVGLTMITGHASAKEMTFDIIYGNHSNYVVADGEITSETPKTFQKFLNTEPFDGFSFYIDLNSPGGSLVGGMELGRMIRKESLISRVKHYKPRLASDESWSPTEEPGTCMSACALAFLGGEDRELDSEGSILGFHQFSTVGASDKKESVYVTEATTQIISSMVHDYISEMGVSTILFSKMSTRLPEEIYVPTNDEALYLNIIPQKSFKNFILEPYGNGVVAYSNYLGNVQARNVVSKITAYCYKGVPYINLSQPDYMTPAGDDWLASANEELSGFSLWKPPGNVHVDYDPTNVALRNKGSSVADIKLDQRGVDILMDESKGVVQIPGFLGRDMAILIQPTETDKNNLRSAFKLCIG